MRGINAIIEVSEACNLRCAYCFHGGRTGRVMDEGTLEHTLNFLSKGNNRVNIVWHGGEPLMAPLSFYKQAVEISNRIKGCTFSFSLQTNGTLLNRESAEFFKSIGASIGISYDGLCNEANRGLTAKTETAFSLLKELQIPFGTICVITAEAVKDLPLIYDDFKAKSLDVKFNPMFLQGSAEANGLMRLNPFEYGEALAKLYGRWAADEDCATRFTTFEEATLRVLRKRTGLCTFNSCLCKWLCVDSQGRIYPCDRLSGASEWELGDVVNADCTKALFANSPTYAKLLELAIGRKRACSKNCPFFEYCYGGCSADALMGSDEPGTWSSSCVVQKAFLKSTIPIVKLLYGRYVDGNISVVKNPRLKKLFEIYRGKK